MRRTKIVATLGPATDSNKVMKKMLEAGVNLVRMNYSHGHRDDHARRVEQVRTLAQKMKLEVGIVADLQGPKIRLTGFRNDSIMLSPGDELVIDPDYPANDGDDHHVGVTYKDLPKDVQAGDTLLIDDGRIILKVEDVNENQVETVVLVGGKLSGFKGINREGGGLSARALTHKDKLDLRHAVEQGVDYIAVSFPRSAEDIEDARRLIKKAGGDCGIIAKIERAEAVDAAEEIILASEAVMVARGDLGVEIGDAALPPVQKHLIQLARQHHKCVITATQMMESMIENTIPTRAEVFDVANAVLDGTDAVMLSAETSVGKHPDIVISAMARVCVGSEARALEVTERRHGGGGDLKSLDHAVALAAVLCANRFPIKAIAALTESGTTTRLMSREQSRIPIFALSRHADTLRRVSLYRGVHAIPFDITRYKPEQVTKAVLDLLVKLGVVEDGDDVLITKGDVHGSMGGTNGMKVVRVGGANDEA